MKILVTGANGYIGLHIVKTLLDKGIQVIACDLNTDEVDKRAERKNIDLFTLPDTNIYTMLWYDGLMHGVNIANLPNVVLKFRMTEALFKKRRNGWVFAKKQLADRLQINKNLHYGHTADLFAYAMFCLLIAPAWVKKIAYKIFR